MVETAQVTVTSPSSDNPTDATVLKEDKPWTSDKNDEEPKLLIHLSPVDTQIDYVNVPSAENVLSFTVIVKDTTGKTVVSTQVYF